MRKKKVKPHNTGAMSARSRNTINQEQIMKERTDVNPNGKELFDAVLRAVIKLEHLNYSLKKLSGNLCMDQ